MKLLFESLQSNVNLLLELMPANYIPTRSLNPRPPVFTRVGISIQKRVDSHLDKTRPASKKKLVMSNFQRTRQECEM